MCVRRFDTMGVQGQDFKAELLGPNSKPSKGLRKANLSPRTKALLEEIALSEQVTPLPLAHAALLPCMCCLSTLHELPFHLACPVNGCMNGWMYGPPMQGQVDERVNECVYACILRVLTDCQHAQ